MSETVNTLLGKIRRAGTGFPEALAANIIVVIVLRSAVVTDQPVLFV
jgi:hypothetical protein